MYRIRFFVTSLVMSTSDGDQDWRDMTIFYYNFQPSTTTLPHSYSDLDLSSIFCQPQTLYYTTATHSRSKHTHARIHTEQRQRHRIMITRRECIVSIFMHYQASFLSLLRCAAMHKLPQARIILLDWSVYKKAVCIGEGTTEY